MFASVALMLFATTQWPTSGVSEAAAGCACETSRTSSALSYESYVGIENEVGQCVATERGDDGGYADWVSVHAGEYQLGTDDVVIAGDREGPARLVRLPAFLIDKYEVSNERFAEFAAASAYQTEAERYGDSFVFSLQLNETARAELSQVRAAAAPWWYKVRGADWRHPDGPDSHLHGRWSEPVVHVSWRDAREYCAWRGGRLPSEAEWEAACRAGARGTRYPWGDQLYPERTHMANIWQGSFPTVNTAKDGFVSTCPVDRFPQNSLGLHNMVGNVWEWVHDDWTPDNSEEKVKKGGSFLCHRSYCYRYRCSARAHNTPDSSASNLGFRCARDP